MANSDNYIPTEKLFDELNYNLLDERNLIDSTGQLIKTYGRMANDFFLTIHVNVINGYTQLIGSETYDDNVMVELYSGYFLNEVEMATILFITDLFERVENDITSHCNYMKGLIDKKLIKIRVLKLII